MDTQITLEPFVFSPDDPLAEAHAAVAEWIEDPGNSSDAESNYGEEPNHLPSGQRLLKGKPGDRRSYLLAAVAQARHWDRMAMRTIRGAPMRRHRRAAAVIDTLIRRELPLEGDDLTAVVEWCLNDVWQRASVIAPLVRAFERGALQTRSHERVLGAMRRLASEIRARDPKTAARIDEVCATSKAHNARTTQAYSPPTPAPAGMPGVLDGLKRFFGMLTDDVPADSAAIGSDNFPLRANSPLQQEHEFLNPLLLDRQKFYTTSRCLPPGEKGRVLLAAADRDAYNLLRKIPWRERSLATHEFADFVLHSDWQLPREGLFDVLLYLAVRPKYDLWGRGNFDVMRLIPQIEEHVAASPLAEGERYVLSLLRASLIDYPPLGATSEEVSRLSRLINDGVCLCVVPGEAWSDAVNDELSRAAAEERRL